MAPLSVSIPLVADSLMLVCEVRKLYVPVILGYRFTWSKVFRLRELDISTSSIITDLFRNFLHERAQTTVPLPGWNFINVVL